MNAPKIPGHTCPTIDKVIQVIDKAFNIADEYKSSDDVESLKTALRDIRHELYGESDFLEKIRAANLALRNAVEYWEAEAEKLAEGAQA